MVPTLLDPFSPLFHCLFLFTFLSNLIGPGSLLSLFCHLLHSPTCSHTNPTACAIQQRLLLPNISLTLLSCMIFPIPWSLTLHTGALSSKATTPRCSVLFHLVTTQFPLSKPHHRLSTLADHSVPHPPKINRHTLTTDLLAFGTFSCFV